MNDTATDTPEAAAAPAAGEEFYCPQCGKRYPGPGFCDNQHPVTQLESVVSEPSDGAEDDGGEAVETAAPSDTPAGAAAPAEPAAPSDAATPEAPDPVAEAKGLVDRINSAVADVQTLVTALADHVSTKLGG